MVQIHVKLSQQHSKPKEGTSKDAADHNIVEPDCSDNHSPLSAVHLRGRTSKTKPSRIGDAEQHAQGRFVPG
ncbi:hypothetical protein COCSUDRAFT_34371 [Coccomyxa subellipsoidea C-169]|uniref:Uncharacterized protein n=1 Tax=Coccomyxa subellipsoidea (strain C-169) TaxID=574566 RepID=I0YL97_COCSC|nr:hypothetical protein COCSUDRAFT_34371 [Coccomyxa subellipsoidea C-169]EIE19166.1 hypothetical protein COCSUDRAFT_34371 [Coccomyxa subellipsoidea C-169]|eukprot:XP_005643710.1 hypothetical protein COCSUDRAFT_34371 [Coccomyxa subellipsoidea C-169]